MTERQKKGGRSWDKQFITTYNLTPAEKAETSKSIPGDVNVEMVRKKMDNAWDKFNEIESAKDNTKEIESAKDNTKEVELVTLDKSPDKDIK